MRDIIKPALCEGECKTFSKCGKSSGKHNAGNWCQAREKGKPIGQREKQKNTSNARKHKTGDRTGKKATAINRCQAQEKMEPTPSAGKHAIQCMQPVPSAGKKEHPLLSARNALASAEKHASDAKGGKYSRHGSERGITEENMQAVLSNGKQVKAMPNMENK